MPSTDNMVKPFEIIFIYQSSLFTIMKKRRQVKRDNRVWIALLLIAAVLIVAVGSYLSQRIMFAPETEAGELVYKSGEFSAKQVGSEYRVSDLYGRDFTRLSSFNSETIADIKSMNLKLSEGDSFDVSNLENAREDYIVEFKSEPVSVKTLDIGQEIEKLEEQGPAGQSSLARKIREKAKTERNYRVKLESEHRADVSAINSILDDRGEIGEEYYNSFNGVSVKDVSVSELNRIRRLRNVKKVYPDLRVQAYLYDSVPLINANDAWSLQVGGENITGKGVSVAVIDTGVDYSHSDFGREEYYRSLERNFTKINSFPISFDSPNIDRAFSLNGEYLDYYSYNSLYRYSFLSGETEMLYTLPYGYFGISKIDSKGDLIAYVADKEYGPEAFLFNVESEENTRVMSMSSVDSVAVIEGRAVFQGGNVIKIYNPETLEIFELEESLPDIAYVFDGDGVIAYSTFRVGENCYGYLVIYNVTSGERREFHPENLGGVLDVRGSKVIYLACGEDVDYNIFYVYDFETGETVILNSENALADASALSSGRNWYQKAAIGDNLAYFSKDGGVDRIAGYDFQLDRYFQLNLFTPSEYFEAEGDKVCFSSSEDIFCHEYDPSYSYPIPDVFNDKVVGGYDFVNDDADPMDDHGHGTHVAATVAGKSHLEVTNYDYLEGDYAGEGEVVLISEGDSNDVLESLKIFNLEGVGSESITLELGGIDDSEPDNSWDIMINGDFADLEAPADEYTYYFRVNVSSLELSVTWGTDAGFGNPGAFTSNLLYFKSRNLGLNGVAPDAEIYAYKVLDYRGYGEWGGIIAAIERATDPNQDGDTSDHVDVISMSLGANCGGEYDENCGPDDPVSRAIDNVVSQGVVAVISAGNSGPDEMTVGTPGTARKAITVAASYTWGETIAEFSSRGPVIWTNNTSKNYLIKPDVTAPGVSICAAQWDSAWDWLGCYDNSHVAISGTSMAAPHVSGAVALMLQAHPDWNPEKIRAQLENSALSIDSNIFSQGYGRIDVLQSLLIDAPVLDISSRLDDNLDVVLSYTVPEGIDSYSVLYQQYGADSWRLLSQGSSSGDFEETFDSVQMDSGILIFKLEVDIGGETFEKYSSYESDNILISSSAEEDVLTGSEEISVKIQKGEFDSYSIIIYNKSSSIGLYSGSGLEDGEIAEINVESVENGRYNLVLEAELASGNVRSKPLDVLVMKYLDGGLIRSLGESRPASLLSVADVGSGENIILLGEEQTAVGGGWYTSKGYVQLIGNNSDSVIGAGSSLFRGDELYEVNKIGRFDIIDEGREQLVLEDKWGSGRDSGNRLGVLNEHLQYIYGWPSEFKDALFDDWGYLSRVFNSRIFPLYEWENYTLSLAGDDIGFWQSKVYKIPVHNRFGGLENVLAFRQFPELEEAPTSYSYRLSPRIGFFSEDSSLAAVFYNYLLIAEDKSEDFFYKLYDYESGEIVIDRDISENFVDHYSTADILSGDLNDDGKTELVYVTSSLNRTLYGQNIFDPKCYYANLNIFDTDGNLVRKNSFEGYVIETPSIITEQNGEKYLVVGLSGTWATENFGTDVVVTLDFDGNQIGNISLGSSQRIVDIVSGDVDGDGETEIVYSTSPRWWDSGENSHIVIVSLNGSIERDVTIYSRNTELVSYLVLDDWNEDGKLDLSFISRSVNSALDFVGNYVYNMPLNFDYDSSRIYWSNYGGNAQRNFCYKCEEEKFLGYIEANSTVDVGSEAEVDINLKNELSVEKTLSYDLSYSLCNFSLRETCDYTSIESGARQLTGGFGVAIPSSLQASSAGEYTLKLDVDDGATSYTDYFSVYSRVGYSDISFDIYQMDFNPFEGEESEIQLVVRNSGNTGASTLASLYHAEGYCPDSCEMELVDSEELFVDARGELFVPLQWIPEIAGQHTLLIVVNSSDGQSKERRAAVNVRKNGAELHPHLEYDGNIIVGKEKEITGRVFNLGNEDADVNLSLYYQPGYCWREECDNLILIESRNVFVQSYYNSNDNFAEELFSWTPEESGYYTLALIANSSNNYYEENQESQFVNVVPEGLNIRGYFSSDNYGREYIIGEENNITLTIVNIGTEDASQVNVSLYTLNYLENGGEEKNLIMSEIVDSLALGESVNVDFSWTPENSGYQQFGLEVQAEGDVDESDNQDYSSFKGILNGIDVSVDYLGVSTPALLNSQSSIYVSVENYGLETDAVLNVYDNGNLIQSEDILDLRAGGYRYIYFLWTPTSLGKHVIRAEVEAGGDLNLSNNYLERVVDVMNIVNVTFDIVDSSGTLADRYLISEAFLDGEGFVRIDSRNMKIPTADLTGGNLEFAIVYMIGDMYLGWDTILGTLLNVSFSDRYDIVSEVYPQIQDSGSDYHSVFANKLNIASESEESITEGSLDYLNSVGIDNLENYSLFYCTDFNFSSSSCNSDWDDAYDAWISYNGNEFDAYGRGERSEAFALSEMTDFDGETTDISSLSGDFASGMTIEKQRYGKIRFLSDVDISRIRQDVPALRRMILFSPRRVIVNSKELPELNVPAQLTFRNIQFRNPQILRDGQLCTDCSGKSYNILEHTLAFNVTGFSEYRVVEGLYCGDGNCNNGETCNSCVADCGSCPAPSPGGGSSGGGSSFMCNPNWTCSWSLCSGNEERYICVDSKHCGTSRNKPAEETRVCLINKDCADADGDGYGIGADCLGADLNDNDPAVTTYIIQPEEIPRNTMILIYSIAGAIVLLFFILIIVLIVRSGRVRAGKMYASKKQMILESARKRVSDLRNGGYSDSEIRQRFKEKGWKDEDLDNLIK